jgi:hypothetical protein
VEGGGEEVLVPRLDRGGEGVELAGGEACGVGEEGGEASTTLTWLRMRVRVVRGRAGKRAAMAVSGVSKWPSWMALRMRVAFSHGVTGSRISFSVTIEARAWAMVWGRGGRRGSSCGRGRGRR